MINQGDIATFINNILIATGIKEKHNKLVKKILKYKKAKLQAGIKPIALCLAINKENLIEFPLDFLYYLYN